MAQKWPILGSRQTAATGGLVGRQWSGYIAGSTSPYALSDKNTRKKTKGSNLDILLDPRPTSPCVLNTKTKTVIWIHCRSHFSLCSFLRNIPLSSQNISRDKCSLSDASEDQIFQRYNLKIPRTLLLFNSDFDFLKWREYIAIILKHCSFLLPWNTSRVALSLKTETTIQPLGVGGAFKVL